MYSARLTNICAYQSWDMTLNIDLDVSFDNTKKRKEIQGKLGEVNGTNAYIRNDGVSLELSMCVTIILIIHLVNLTV
jgi:hypothetical protein